MRLLTSLAVSPDVPAPYRLAWSAGRDAILQAGLLAARAWAEEATRAEALTGSTRGT